MSVHVGECVLGVFAFDEKGELIGSATFPKDANEIADRLLVVRRGHPTEEHHNLVSELIAKGHKKFCLESEKLAAGLRDGFKDAEFEAHLPNRAGEVLRGSLREMAVRAGFEDVDELLRDVNTLVTREGLRRNIAGRDRLVIQAIDTMDDVDATANTLYGRIREWYSIHFPELDRMVPEHQDYAKLVSELGARENFSAEAVKERVEFPDEQVARIVEAAGSSVGANFDEVDIQTLRECVERVQALYEVRDRMVEYVDGLMAHVAPNAREVAGSAVGARLISMAGGLKQLARMPSSTLQVLGAEKALFRALHGRGSPPKHGLIYQYPDIRGSPKALRGKISRALAGKLSIAVRVDAVSGEFVGDKLKADLETKIALIRTKAAVGGK